MSPWFPVTWIMYWPGRMFPTVKLPYGVPLPTWMAQATVPAKMTLWDGLEMVQRVSVGRKPLAVTKTWVPGCPVAGLNPT